MVEFLILSPSNLKTKNTSPASRSEAFFNLRVDQYKYSTGVEDLSRGLIFGSGGGMIE